MKECCICHEIKKLDSFHKHLKAKDGYNTRCKECQNEYNKGSVFIKRHSNNCLHCGNHVKSGHKYCSIDCRRQYEWMQRKCAMETTGNAVTSLTNNDAAARKWAKKYLIEKYGYKCMICGVEEWLGQPVMLICDHIDGNASNIKLNNFRIICPNCNSTLPTYGNRNKGKGRGSLGLTK